MKKLILSLLSVFYPAISSAQAVQTIEEPSVWLQFFMAGFPLILIVVMGVIVLRIAVYFINK